MRLNNEEIRAMLSYLVNIRYQYTIKRIADTETM